MKTEFNLFSGLDKALSSMTKRQREEIERRGKQRLAEQKDFDDFVKRAFQREASETIAAERRKREDEQGAKIERWLVDLLQAEHLRTWPDEITRQMYQAEMKRFGQWARAQGLAILPAQASTVAAYLIDLAINGDTHSSVQQTAKAIEFAHDLSHHYLDRAYINAALAFIRGMEIEAEKTKNEGA